MDLFNIDLRPFKQLSGSHRCLMPLAWPTPCPSPSSTMGLPRGVRRSCWRLWRRTLTSVRASSSGKMCSSGGPTSACWFDCFPWFVGIAPELFPELVSAVNVSEARWVWLNVLLSAWQLSYSVSCTIPESWTWRSPSTSAPPPMATLAASPSPGKYPKSLNTKSVTPPSFPWAVGVHYRETYSTHWRGEKYQNPSLLTSHPPHSQR